jgi:hypothetical protein
VLRVKNGNCATALVSRIPLIHLLRLLASYFAVRNPVAAAAGKRETRSLGHRERASSRPRRVRAQLLLTPHWFGATRFLAFELLHSLGKSQVLLVGVPA